MGDRHYGGGSDPAELRRAADKLGIRRLTTATDGNHGRAVARMAATLELEATIYVPAAMAEVRRSAITDEGASVVDVVQGYDEAVRTASVDAAGDPRCRAVNDADMDGSRPVAGRVIEGYSTLFAEIDEQTGGADIDLVMLQTGVGAFAACGTRWAKAHNAAAVAVDPSGAACVATSLAKVGRQRSRQRRPQWRGSTRVPRRQRPGRRSKQGLWGAVVVSDEEADSAMRSLGPRGSSRASRGRPGWPGCARCSKVAAVRAAARTGGPAALRTRGRDRSSD